MPPLLIIGNDILMVRLEYSTSKSLATVGKINDAGGAAVPGTFRLLTRLHHSGAREMRADRRSFLSLCARVLREVWNT